MNIPPFKPKFADSVPSKVNKLRQQISNDVDSSQQERGKPFCFKMYHVFSALLPNLNPTPSEFKHFYNLNIVDTDVKDDLKRSKVISWCRTAKQLYPIKTRGDGNCLLHAVSLSIWGIDDSTQFLRRLVYLTLANDSSKLFHKRWLMQQRSIILERPNEFNPNLDSKDWEQEWDAVINAALDIPSDEHAALAFQHLEGIHLFVLANILRRPIIVLADRTARSVFGQSMQRDNIGGIYLPLHWHHSETCRSPVTIGYSLNHFTALLPQRSVRDGRVMDSEYVIPLVYHDFEPLIVRFLLYTEESLGHELLNSYIVTKNMPLTTSDSVLHVPVANGNYQLISSVDKDVDIVKHHFEECQQIYSMWIGRSCPVVNVPQPRDNFILNNETLLVTSQSSITETRPMFQTSKCKTPGCKMYASYDGMCSNCFKNYTVEYEKKETQKRDQYIMIQPTAPPQSMPPLPSGNFCDLSIMGENCINFIHCGNRTSVNTYPYCHECRPHDSITSGSIQQEVGASPPHAVRNEHVDESTLFGEGQSLEGVKPLQTDPMESTNAGANNQQQCIQPGCKNPGMGNYNDLCKECSLNYGRPRSQVQNHEEPSSQTFLLNSPFAQSSSSGVTPSPGMATGISFPINNLGMEHVESGKRIGMCKSSSCSEYGFEHLNGLCRKCHENLKDKKSWKFETSNEMRMYKNLCCTPGCKGEKIKNPHGFCYQCFLRNENPTTEVSQTPVPPPDSTMESKTPLATNEMPKECIVTSSKDKVKCASPLCNALIYPPKQLCDSCTSILQKSHAENASRSRSMEVNRNHPARQGSAYSPTRKKCLTERCEFYGDKKYHGYCSNCYQVAKSSTTQLRKAPDISSHVRQVNTSPTNTRPLNCVEPGCDKFGDPNMSYRCTEHYRQVTRPGIFPVSGPYPLPAEVERYNVAEKDIVNVQASVKTQMQPQHQLNIPVIPNSSRHNNNPEFSQVMQKVEMSRKSNKCRTPSCDNYGNSKKHGYCNSCFNQQMGERGSSHRNHLGNDNYQCC